MSDPYRSYTRGERSRRAGYVLRGVRQAASGSDTSRYERAIDRIDERAEDRGYREASAAYRLLEDARDTVAAAKAKEHAAGNGDRRAAREARKKAEQALRSAERAARKFGL